MKKLIAIVSGALFLTACTHSKPALEMHLSNGETVNVNCADKYYISSDDVKHRFSEKSAVSTAVQRHCKKLPDYFSDSLHQTEQRMTFEIIHNGL